MIKKTVHYNNFDGDPIVEVMYFHIKKSEIFDNLDLEEEFSSLQKQIDGLERELTKPEIMQVLALVKRLLKLSYGVRSEDAKHHRKSPEIWDDFFSSNAYDTILFELFEEPKQAVDFMIGIMPKELVDAANLERERRRLLNDHLPKQSDTPSSAGIEAVVFDEASESPEEMEARIRAQIAQENQS